MLETRMYYAGREGTVYLVHAAPGFINHAQIAKEGKSEEKEKRTRRMT